MGAEKKVQSVLAILSLILAFSVWAEPAARTGRVQFSNGETFEGKISITPGEELKVIRGKSFQSIALERVREIRMQPAEEKMEREWRFIEPGRPMKEFWGEPYPTRHLEASVVLATGEIVSGHLYTTVLYVEGQKETRKVILYAKQRGKQGETFDALTYPSRITFLDAAEKVVTQVRVPYEPEGVGAGDLAALTVGPLVRLEGRGGKDGLQMESPMGQRVFLAVETSDAIRVGWPAQADEKLAKLIGEALKNDLKDFFDDRELLGVYREGGGSDLFSLVMLRRKGGTTLGGARTQPWRLDVLRWKYDEESGRLMVGGRGYFFRGITGRREEAPPVKLSETLWSLRDIGVKAAINGD